jgi:hypothetical protein
VSVSFRISTIFSICSSLIIKGRSKEEVIFLYPISTSPPDAWQRSLKDASVSYREVWNNRSSGLTLPVPGPCKKAEKRLIGAL